MMNEYIRLPFFLSLTNDMGRYSRDYNTINYSEYDVAQRRKSSTTNGGSKENTPCVKSFREIENTIILNPKAMEELKSISAEQNKPNQTFSDLIVFLIKQYRIIQTTNDPIARNLYKIHQNDELL